MSAYLYVGHVLLLVGHVFLFVPDTSSLPQAYSITELRVTYPFRYLSGLQHPVFQSINNLPCPIASDELGTSWGIDT